MYNSVASWSVGGSVLARAIRSALGVAMTLPALPALSLDTLNPEQNRATVAHIVQDYHHLSMREQAAAILTQGGKMAIDRQTDTLYASDADTQLSGRTLAGLAALAWGVPETQLSRSQLDATEWAMTVLQLDSGYPYGSLPQVQATVLKRLAQSMDQQQLLAQYGIGSSAYLCDNDSLDIPAVVQQLFTRLAQQPGVQGSEQIDLTERVMGVSAGNGLPVILISGSDSVLRGQAFDPLAGVIAVDAEDGDLSEKLLLQGRVDTDRIGHYELKYSVTDSQGQHTDLLRTVRVTQHESSRPRINGAGPKLVYTGQDFDPMAGVTAWDEEESDLTNSITVSGQVDTSKAGIYLVNYQVIDRDGHSHRRNRVVLVENLRAKSITFKGLQPEFVNLYETFQPMAGVSASDETDGDLTGQIQVSNPVDTSQGGLYRVRYQVSNSQGASKTRFKTVIVQNSLPQLTLEGVTSLELGQEFDPMAGVSALDREDGDLTDRVEISGMVNNQIPDVYTLRYRVTDNNGGSAERTRRVRVSNITSADNTLATINVERFTRVAVDGHFDPMAGVSAVDEEDGDLTALIKVTGQVDTTTPGHQLLVYSVTDSVGSVSSVERTIDVYNQVPVITGANSLALPLGAPFNPMAGVSASDAEDGDLSAAIEVTGAVDTSKGGLYSLVYKVADRHGGEGFALRAVVVANTVPQIHGLEPVTISHDQPFDPLAGVTASDAEDGDLTALIEVSDNLDISRPGAYVLTYTVRDSSGALATGMRGVVVKNTIPEIRGIAPITMTAGEPFDPFAGITAWDNEDGDLSAALQVSGQMDSNKPGIYTLHYLVRDSKGGEARRGRSVLVKAAYNNAPAIDGVDATTVVAGQPFDPLAGISASDAEDGDLTSVISVSGSVNNARAGRYRLTYRVQDSGGKRDTAYRTVTVTNSAPVFAAISNQTISVGSEFDPMAGISASDPEEGDLSDRITITGQVDITTAGRYTLHYRVADSFGRYASKYRTITVTNSAPVLDGLERVSVPYGAEFDPMAGVSAIDAEDGNLTDRITVSGSVDSNRSGVYRVKYSVSDNHGKTTIRTRSVNVKSRFFS